MSSIALFPCAFTGGAIITKALCENLNLFRYDDDDLINEAINLFDCKKETLEEMLYGRTSVFNQFTLEREKTINLFRLILADKLASEDNFLFYGHLALLIPLDITEVLTTLAVNHKKGRIARAVHEGLTDKEALKIIKFNDLRAYRWTDFLFNQEAFESSLYDVVTTYSLGEEEKTISDITSFFRKTSVLRSLASQKAVRDMKLAALVERQLLRRGHALEVKANDDDITITVRKSVLNFAGLENEVMTIAMGVDGVHKVTVNKSMEYTDSIYRQQKFELPSKVLFVDDEHEFVETVAQRLISRDVGTYGVYNGADALELIKDDCPDVMVLDLKMPGMHGVDVLKKAKELHPKIEVIILTGHGSVEDEDQCMELGAFAYMNKPVDIEKLSTTITAANTRSRENSPQLS